MITEITEDTIYDAISISWTVAHQSENYDSWLNRWSRVKSALEGMWFAINYSSANRDEIVVLLDEITFLENMAFNHMSDMENFI